MKNIKLAEIAIVIITVSAIFSMGLESKEIALAAVSGLTGVLVGRSTNG